MKTLLGGENRLLKPTIRPNTPCKDDDDPKSLCPSSSQRPRGVKRLLLLLPPAAILEKREGAGDTDPMAAKSL